MICRLAITALVFTCCGLATTIVSVSGGKFQGSVQPTPYTGISWTQSDTFVNVSIYASLGTPGTVYLTNKIGNDTTVANEIARLRLTNIPDPNSETLLFSGLTLNAGTYGLVSTAGWNEYSDPLSTPNPYAVIQTLAPGASFYEVYGFGPFYYTDPFAYPPAFVGRAYGYTFQFQVIGDPAPLAPEPKFLGVVLLTILPLTRFIKSKR